MEKKRNPWAWVPTLYIGEGLPNVVVTVVAATMFMQLGMVDTEITFYVGWLGIPWIIKPLWSPFVDLYKTKRWWVLAMQALLCSAYAGVAFMLNTSIWFQGVLAFLFLMAFSSSTHDIAADGYYMLELDEHQQAWFVGIRNTFYRLAVIFGKGVFIPLAGVFAVWFRGQKAFAWSLVFYAVAGLFLALWLFHAYIMPKPECDQPHETTARDVICGIRQTFITFCRKMPLRETMFAIIFILFYRFPESLLNTVSITFLQRKVSEGGLGLTPFEFGLANGTVGTVGLLLGGILGGWLASRDGLKRWLWTMVCALTLPDIIYVYLSMAMPHSLFIVSTCLFVEQFGYGLGFTALTLYMLYYSQGTFKTSHYAICTGISYLGLTLPGMISGYIKDSVGYPAFFLIVMFSCIITFLVTAFLKIDPEFGKKQSPDNDQ